MAQTQNDDEPMGVLPNHMYDTRTLSMGSTTIADLYGRSSMGINPALSGLHTKSSSIQFNSLYNWENNLVQHDLTLPTLSDGSHHFTTRLGYFHKGINYLPFSRSSSMADPVVRLYRAEVAYAIALSDYFSIGTLQSISFSIASDETTDWNYFADIGLLYVPDGPVSYGIVFRGLGRETTYGIIQTGETTLGSNKAAKILDAGITFRFPIEDRTWLSISFANEKRFGEEGVWYKGGAEIIPISVFSIRGGVKANFDQSLFIPQFGLGISASVLRIDYMFAPKNPNVRQFHQIGLTFEL